MKVTASPSLRLPGLQSEGDEDDSTAMTLTLEEGHDDQMQQRAWESTKEQSQRE